MSPQALIQRFSIGITAAVLLSFGVTSSCISAPGAGQKNSDANSGKQRVEKQESKSESKQGSTSQTPSKERQTDPRVTAPRQDPTPYQRPPDNRNDKDRVITPQPTPTWGPTKSSTTTTTTQYNYGKQPTPVTNNYQKERPKPGNPPNNFNQYNPGKERAYPQSYYGVGRYFRPSVPITLGYRHWVHGPYDPAICRRSIYYSFGVLPYVHVTRLHVGTYVSIGYRSGPVVFDSGYYLTRDRTTRLDLALQDIRLAWLYGRMDLIRAHVRHTDRIAVLLDGRYDYSIQGDDYIQMTADAFDQIRTTSFNWDTVRERTDGRFTAFARHEYRDNSNITKIVYTSYTFDVYGGEYYIIEVGSSASPLF